MLKLKNSILTCFILFVIIPTCFSQELTSQNQVELNYFNFVRKFSGKNFAKVHVLIVPLYNTNFAVKPVLAKASVGKLQRTSKMAEDNNAIAAINGSFFRRNYPYTPIGLLVIDGKILTKSLLRRTAIGIGANNEITFGIPKFVGHIINDVTKEKIPIWGINRPRKENEAIIYTPEYGPNTKTNKSGVELIVEDNMVVGISEGASPIPENGYVISFHGWTKNYVNDIPPGSILISDYTLSDGWDKFAHVLTAGPRLLESGKIVVSKSIYNENFGDELRGRYARSAIGIDKYKNLYFVLVEGKKKSKYQRGCTYFELAQLLQDLGLYDAMGLDGGGSATMYLYGKGVVNTPSDGIEQCVSNAIIVYKKE